MFKILKQMKKRHSGRFIKGANAVNEIDDD